MRKNLKEARQRAGMTQKEVVDNKIQTGLRIPEKQYDRVKERAEQMGVSINQLILVLIDIGLNFLDKKQSE